MKSVPDRRLPICFFLLWLLLSSSSAVCGNSDTPSQDKHGVPSDPLTDTAFEHFYNMEYDRATQEFEKHCREASGRPFLPSTICSRLS